MFFEIVESGSLASWGDMCGVRVEVVLLNLGGLVGGQILAKGAGCPLLVEVL